MRVEHDENLRITAVKVQGDTALAVARLWQSDGKKLNTRITYNLTHGAPAGGQWQTVTVNYATADGTATAGSDYTATSGTLTFAPGVTTQTVGVPIIGDNFAEPDETFSLNLTAPVNAVLSDGQGIGTILGANGGQGDTAPVLTLNFDNPTDGSLLTNLNLIYGSVTDNTGAPVNLKSVDILILQNQGGYYNGSGYVGAATPLPANVSGNRFSLNAGLSGPNILEGDYTITAQALDSTGKYVTRSAKVTIDTRAPVVRFMTPVDNSRLVRLSVIAGTATDVRGRGVTHVDLYLQRVSDRLFFNGTTFTQAGTPLKTTYSAASGRWTLRTGLPTAAQLTPGRYVLTAKAFDRASFIGRQTIDFEIIPSAG